jgi:CRISPR system Cascade subunit CasB
MAATPRSDQRHPSSEREDAIRRWWKLLQPDDAGKRRGDRAALARLRRAASLVDLLDEPSLFDLYRRMGFRSEQAERHLGWVAAVAMVLAHVREDERRQSPARTVGRKEWSDESFDTARMKPLRFQRLLAAEKPEYVAREMRRLVAMAERRINVGALGDAILAWASSESRERIRVRWAFDYHAAGEVLPAATDATAPDADSAATQTAILSPS